MFSLSALRTFFSSAISSTTSPRLVSDDAALPRHRDKEKEKEMETGFRWAPRTQRSGLHSFVMKFFFDQTVAGAMNIVLFVVLINFLKGESVGQVWELVLVVCFSLSMSFFGTLGFCNEIYGRCLLISLGFSSHHDRPSEISPRGVNTDVHGHPCRPASRLWQRLWGDLGRLSQFVRCGLAGVSFFVFFLFPFSFSPFWRHISNLTSAGIA